ncbi:MAG: hypothetical protein KGJ06_01400 [Pseudomonadota bacterium]|nr:hypothetical protein [Pseudomonadota bacterium]
MKDAQPIEDLIKSTPFKSRMTAALALEDPVFTVSVLRGGMAKQVYKVTDEQSGKSFIVKEIRFEDRFTVQHDYVQGQMSPSRALYELNTIKAIAKDRRIQAKYFPKNYGLFAYAHPVIDPLNYDNPVLEEGRLIAIEKAKGWMKKGYGASFFIAEELIQGRDPTPEEYKEHEKIRERELPLNPRIWLTVDTGGGDVIVTADGPKFIDLGEFAGLTSEEKKMVKTFMGQEGKGI